MGKRHRGKGAWGMKGDKPEWEDLSHSKNLGLGMIEDNLGGRLRTSLSKEEESDLNHELTLLHQLYFGGKIGKDKTFESVGMESALDLFQTFEKYHAARRARDKSAVAYNLSKLLGLPGRKSMSA